MTKTSISSVIGYLSQPKRRKVPSLYHVLDISVYLKQSDTSINGWNTSGGTVRSPDLTHIYDLTHLFFTEYKLNGCQIAPFGSRTSVNVHTEVSYRYDSY